MITFDTSFLEGRPDSTRRVYAGDLEWLESFAGERGRALTAWDVADARSYAQQLIEKGLAVGTRSRMIAVASAYFSFLLDRGAVAANPFRQVRRPRVDRHKGKTPLLTLEQVRKLIGAIDRRTPEGRRDLAIALLLFNCAARVGEALKTRLDMLGRSSGLCIIHLASKGDRERQLVLPDYVAEILDEHISSWPITEGFIFRSRQMNQPDRHLTERAYLGAIKRYALVAGLNPRGVRTHCGRVFWITTGLKQTGDIVFVSEEAGHSSIQQTELYARTQRGIEDNPSLHIRLLNDDQAVRQGRATS